MKTYELIVLRLYMVTLGRIAFFAHLLRRILVRVLVKGRRSGGYHASSRFFSVSELDGKDGSSQ